METFEITYVGGPYDGQRTYFSDMGNTWSRATVKDNGETIGFYYHWGPDQFTYNWESIEEFRDRERRWLHLMETASETDKEAIEQHIKKLTKEQHVEV
jgi:hypothetical protein